MMMRHLQVLQMLLLPVVLVAVRTLMAQEKEDERCEMTREMTTFLLLLTLMAS
jgi:hypothetical protein